ncbi:hypothetical protein PVK06_017505 [Gossypium arboreum]|uniref:Aminotransferase-like plant mobile domain-containing protein n=1 Tax=Gossypium arboreum TaxID=29729 RepID=A0ABR0Q397_GOSAR|nr:hypothetical protein PVK06_017505 [Gossypium arboreum]
MPDLLRNLVHLRWLLKLIYFRAVGELSWGSAVLATLYKKMYGATRPNKAKIGDCLSLLQSWARFRFSFLRPRVDHPYIFSLITRWNHSASYVGIPISLEDIQLLLDQRSEAQDPWQAIFIVGREEATTNSCPKGTTGPFKSKKKGRRCRPINSANTITRPNGSTDDTYITVFSDYVRCVS